MTYDEIFEANQFIALFMDWELEDIRIYLSARDGHMGKLAFNRSWDLLMPVIEKIERLPTENDNEEYQFSITGDGIAITKYDDGSGVVVSAVNEIGKSKLQGAFECVAFFCKNILKNEIRKPKT